MFLSIITSRLAGPIATACAIALACFLLAASLQVVGLKHKLANVTAERNTAIANYTLCQSNRITLETSIASQNAAVSALEAESVRRAKEADKAMQRARAGAVEANRRAEAIRRQVSRDACGDDLILGSVR